MANNFENPEEFMEVAKAAAGHYADSYAVKLLAFSENATYLVYDPATMKSCLCCVLGVLAIIRAKNTKAR